MAFGLALGVGLFASPVAALAQSDSVGGWKAISRDNNSCGLIFNTVTPISGPPTKLDVRLIAFAPDPSNFVLILDDPFKVMPDTQQVITLSFDDGVEESLHGSIKTDAAIGRSFRASLSGSSDNNFATFLHGFTAASNMTITASGAHYQYSLMGTSKAIGLVGQCTDTNNFNNLPTPWRPADEQPAAPVTAAAPSAPDAIAPDTIAPDAPAPTANVSPEVAPAAPAAPPPPETSSNGWWMYAYSDHTCEPSDETPKQVYDDEDQEGRGPMVDRVDPDHVRIAYPDAQNSNLEDFNDFFRSLDACKTFGTGLANQNSDLN